MVLSLVPRGFPAAMLVLALAMRQQEEPPKPGKNHELLKRFDGSWQVHGKFWDETGKSTAEFTFVETGTLCCNGLWLIYTDKGEYQGKPYEGHGTLGYDEHKKKFVGTWVDSMGTSIDIGEGSLDEKGKVFTYVSAVPDADGNSTRYKRVTEIKSDDLQMMTVY